MRMKCESPFLRTLLSITGNDFLFRTGYIYLYVCSKLTLQAKAIFISKIILSEH